MYSVKGKLIGYRKFTSKKNQEFCVANVMLPCSDRDLANGYVGNRVDETFLPDNMVDYLKPQDVDKEVEILYSVSGGRAYVDDFRVLRK